MGAVPSAPRCLPSFGYAARANVNVHVPHAPPQVCVGRVLGASHQRAQLGGEV